VPQNRSGRGGEEKNSQPPIIQRSTTELTRLHRELKGTCSKYLL